MSHIKQQSLAAFFKSPVKNTITPQKQTTAKKRSHDEIFEQKDIATQEQTSTESSSIQKEESEKKRRKVDITEDLSDELEKKLQTLREIAEQKQKTLADTYSSYQESDIRAEILQHEKTVQELQAFRRDIAAITQPCTIFPEDHIKLLAKIIQDSSLQAEALVDEVHAILFKDYLPETTKQKKKKKGEEEDVISPSFVPVPMRMFSHLLPKNVIQAKLDLISSYENYGVSYEVTEAELSDGETTIGNGFELWRREINTLTFLPTDIRGKVKNRRSERKALRKNLNAQYKELRKIEKEIAKLQKKLDNNVTKILKKAEKQQEQQKQKQIKQKVTDTTTPSAILKFTKVVQKIPVVEENKRSLSVHYQSQLTPSDMDDQFFKSIQPFHIKKVLAELKQNGCQLTRNKRSRRIIYFSRINYDEQDRYSLLEPYIGIIPRPQVAKVVINGRRWFKQEPSIDYDEPCYDDIEEEEIFDDGIEGEDLRDDDDDDDEDEEEEVNAYFGAEGEYNSDEDEDFVVADGYTSPLENDDDEDNEDGQSLGDAIHDKRKQNVAQKFEKTPKKGKKEGLLVPLILNTQFIGPILTVSSDDNSADATVLRSYAIRHFTTNRSFLYNDILQDNFDNNTSINNNENNQWKRFMKEENDLIALCHFVHKSDQNKPKLIQEFCEKYNCSKNSVSKQLMEIAVKEKREGDMTALHYIKDIVMKDLGIDIKSSIKPETRPLIVYEPEPLPPSRTNEMDVDKPKELPIKRERRRKKSDQVQDRVSMNMLSLAKRLSASAFAPQDITAKNTTTVSTTDLAKYFVPKTTSKGEVSISSPPSPNTIRVK
jgi:hypothetical protein